MTDAEEKDDTDRYRAPALDKGLDILELLAEQKDGLTRAEITKLLGRNASEMYRMLERLVARQYVGRSAGGRRSFGGPCAGGRPLSPNLKVVGAGAPPPADEPADLRSAAADAAFLRP